MILYSYRVTKGGESVKEELKKIKTTLKFIQLNLILNEITLIIILLKQLLYQ